MTFFLLLSLSAEASYITTDYWQQRHKVLVVNKNISYLNYRLIRKINTTGTQIVNVSCTWEYGKEGNGKLKRTAETDDGKWAWSRTQDPKTLSKGRRPGLGRPSRRSLGLPRAEGPG